MGRVYLAEQSQPVQRRVALKVMRNPLADREAQLRFNAERQALARLQHSNVAHMFEAGTTDDGYPFFAMELVDGMPLVSYCDRQKLSLHQRLDLFCAVCEGVQHAHQKGVLHRDLTPANILVTEAGGRPVPKIIDFGIAKALDQPLVEETLLTGERVIGTPAYLSPEAIDGSKDIDTRSDVYSLGVLLYELLVGVRPFDTKGQRLIQILHRIVDEEPSGPSSRWTTLDLESKQRIAGQRGLEMTALRKRLRGDLDWIVLKAIAKDRKDRYGTPAELAADIRRHLNHQPVEASPPSRLYRFSKFVRRHRSLVAVLLVLVVAGVKYTYDLRREQQRTMAALTAAEQARNEAEQVSSFLVDVFEVSDPGEARGNEITAREILERGAERLDHELSEQPLVRARLLDTIGMVYYHLGLYQESAEMRERTVEILRAEHQGDHPDLASALHYWGDSLYMLDRYDKDVALLEEGLAMRRRMYPSPHPAIAASLAELGNLRFDQGRLAEARDLLERSLAIRRQTGDEGSVHTTMWTLAEVLTQQGEHRQAEALYQEVVQQIETSLGPDHPTLASVLESFATLYLNQDGTDRATPLLRRAFEIRKKVLDPDHPNLGISAAYLGHICSLEGRFEEGEHHLRQALGIFEAAFGKDHFNVGASLIFLGDLYLQSGRYDQAAATYQRSLAIWEAAGLAEGHNALSACMGLAQVKVAQGQWQQAAALFRKAIAYYESQREAETLAAVSARAELAAVLRHLGRYDEADQIMVPALADARQLVAAQPESQELVKLVAEIEIALGALRADQGETKEAQSLWRQADSTLQRLEAGHADRPDDTDHALLVLRARVLLHLGQHQAAAPLVQQLAAIGWADADLDELLSEPTPQ
jgi:tetratricopeptide (TPR) repeat protein/tRNA A-37 threonylcarbamoyl transferase component Bud32